MINLQGTSTYLRAPEQSDLEQMYHWENDTSVWKVSNTLVPFSRFVLEQYLLNAHLDIFINKQIRLFICNKQDNPIGSVDLFDYEPLHHRAGIGIVIAEPFRNKGFADDALKTLLTYCTDVLMLKQVYCNIGASNEASIKLFENNAFEKVGLKKAWNLVAQNKFEDEWLLQRINK